MCRIFFMILFLKIDVALRVGFWSWSGCPYGTPSSWRKQHFQMLLPCTQMWQKGVRFCCQIPQLPSIPVMPPPTQGGERVGRNVFFVSLSMSSTPKTSDLWGSLVSSFFHREFLVSLLLSTLTSVAFHLLEGEKGLKRTSYVWLIAKERRMYLI